MKRALVTLLDDKFVIGAEVFLKSFLHFNPWFSDEFIMFDNGISEENKDMLFEMYNGVIFKKINKKKYADVNLSRTHDKLKATYYTLEVFSLYDYDRLTFIDMDTVVLDNIKEIFEQEDNISGCKVYNARTDRLGETINTGVFTINRDCIDKHIYNGLIRVAQRGHSSPDQKTINRFFRSKISYINKRYNVEKRMQHSTKYRYCFDEAKILHYVATKPWEAEKPNPVEASFEEAEKIWLDWYNK